MNERNTFYYWINLSGRTDRRLHMINQFAENGITRHIRISPVEHEKSQSSCTLSHMKAILTAHEDGCEYAVILEDDIILKDIHTLTTVTSNLPDDWEIFQFHTSCPILYERLSGNKKYQNQTIKGHLMSAAGYVVTKRGIEKYVQKFLCLTEKKHLKFQTLILDYEFHPPETCVFVFMTVYFLLYPLFNTLHMRSSIRQKNSDNDYLNSLWIDKLTKVHSHIRNINYDIIFDNGMDHWYSSETLDSFITKLQELS